MHQFNYTIVFIIILLILAFLLFCWYYYQCPEVDGYKCSDYKCSDYKCSDYKCFEPCTSRDFYRKSRHVLKMGQEKLFFKTNGNNFIHNIGIKSNIDAHVKVVVVFTEGNTFHLYDGELSRLSTLVITQEMVQQYKGACFYITSQDQDIHATFYLRGFIYD